MKGIKYISPYGTSGYAEAGKDYMIALHKLGVPITWQPKYFDPAYSDYNDERNRLVDSFIDKEIEYDIVIIHTTPEWWKKTIEEEKGKFIIGMTVWETDKLHPDWVGYINQVDLVFVPCVWNKEVFIKSGIKSRIEVVPHIIKEVEKIESDITGVREGDYVFYTIGQWSVRKGVEETLIAYCEEFTNKEKVSLILKTFSDNYSIGQKDRTEKRVQDILNRYPEHANVVLLEDELNDDEIVALHNFGDAYASLCKAEGWGLGAFDASALNKPVIMTNYGGQCDFLHPDYLVDYKLIPVRGMSWIPWYLEEQNWAEPNIKHASQLMRKVFINKPTVYHKTYENFNYKIVGSKLLKILNTIR